MKVVVYSNSGFIKKQYEINPPKADVILKSAESLNYDKKYIVGFPCIELYADDNCKHLLIRWFGNVDIETIDNKIDYYNKIL